jgi:sec-independent protein translocase protein TatC
MEKNDLIRLFEELRKRLIIITVTVFVFAIISFSFSEQVRHILLIPGDMAYAGLETEGLNLQLIFLTPSEALLANIRLAFITSATITLPFILYQLLALAMSVAGRAKKTALILTMVMYILFAMGLSFSYFVVLPFALNFFIGFSGADLVPNFSIARYISFTTSFIFSFGLVFQLPVVFWFLGSIGLVNTAFLRRNRKFALLIIVIFAAILTPPDIFSQVLMAIPLMLLYELGIFMVYLASRKKTTLNRLIYRPDSF